MSPEVEARAIAAEIKKVLLEKGLWFSFKEQYKNGELDILKFEEISIKVK